MVFNENHFYWLKVQRVLREFSLCASIESVSWATPYTRLFAQKWILLIYSSSSAAVVRDQESNSQAPSRNYDVIAFFPRVNPPKILAKRNQFLSDSTSRNIGQRERAHNRRQRLIHFIGDQLNWAINSINVLFNDCPAFELVLDTSSSVTSSQSPVIANRVNAPTLRSPLRPPTPGGPWIESASV